MQICFYAALLPFDAKKKWYPGPEAFLQLQESREAAREKNLWLPWT